jgi:hypothetical protein
VDAEVMRYITGGVPGAVACLALVRRAAPAFIHHTINDPAKIVQQNRPGYLNCYLG